MFRFENYYIEIPLLQKHHQYIQEKKAKEQRNRTIKTAAVLLTTAAVALLVYKQSGWKNMLKGHFG